MVYSREATKGTGRRCVDPHILAKFQELSLVKCGALLTRFLWLITETSYVFSTPGKLDDLVVEWKNRDSPSRSDFEATLAATETALPHDTAAVAMGEERGVGIERQDVMWPEDNGRTTRTRWL